MTLHTATESYWQGTVAEPIHYPRLNQDIWVDVAVIGAGITGLTAALLLKQAGKKVAVLEGGRVGSGTTGGTSAHLTAVTDLPLDKLIDNFGMERAAIAIEAQEMAIDQIRRWVEGFEIQCEFQPQTGYRFCELERDVDALERECDAALKLGLPATMTREVPLPFRCAAAMKVDDQARFHSLDYLHTLARIVHGGGCDIYEHTRAREPEDGEPCRIETPGGTVNAEAVIVATHAPYLGLFTLVVRVFPYQSYCIGVRVDNAELDGLFWDTADPYHYIRRASDDEPDLLIIGGADHKTGQGGDEREHFDALERYARQRLKVRSVDYRWSAEFYEPADGLPYIGRMPRMKHVYEASGYSGTGLTFGTAAGMLMADQVLGRPNHWEPVFDPSRVKPRASTRPIVTENLNVAREWIGRRIAPHDTVKSLEDVPLGEGRIVKIKGENLAVYHSPQGEYHAMSPVCTHLYCNVEWNDAEKTWDCPCHGGRYTPEGKIFYGPPSQSLEPKELKAPKAKRK